MTSDGESYSIGEHLCMSLLFINCLLIINQLMSHCPEIPTGSKLSPSFKSNSSTWLQHTLFVCQFSSHLATFLFWYFIDGACSQITTIIIINR